MSLSFIFPKLDNSMGAVLVGSFLASALYGLTTHQFFRYFRMYPTDPARMKRLIITLWILDTLHLVFTMHSSYYYLITKFLQPEALLEGVWSFELTISITGIITLLTHMFFAERIFILSKGGIWVSGVITVTSLARLAFCIGTTVLSIKASTFTNFDARFFWVLASALGLAAFSDIVITIALFYFLLRSNKHFASNSTPFDKLLIYSINTGLLTSVLAVADLICALTMRNNLIFLGLYFVTSKMYSNSLMAVLNARRSTYAPSQIGSFDLGDNPGRLIGEGRERPSNYLKVQGKAQVLDIKVTQEVCTVRDHMSFLDDFTSQRPSPIRDHFPFSSFMRRTGH